MASCGKNFVVTEKQIKSIENEIFKGGMPIPSLMEKASLACVDMFCQLFPLFYYQKVGFLIGCGHNGGDGLVMARELFLRGYDVCLYIPLVDKLKDLTANHYNYCHFLGLNIVEKIEDLACCDVTVDGLFGFGLNREIEGFLRDDINWLNSQSIPVVSIDLPSGIHTDTGNVLGIAVKATHTFCLGLWKLGLFQAVALEYVGKLHLLDIGIPSFLYESLLENATRIEVITGEEVKGILPLPRNVNTHKYKQGNLLLICGSRQYAGAALLSGYGAKSSGVGMVTLAVPESLSHLMVSHFPWALVIPLPETEMGTIRDIDSLSLNGYGAIALGMGITRHTTPARERMMRKVIEADSHVIIDADGLNLLAMGDYTNLLHQRQKATILTPHEGEFKRLFPSLDLNRHPWENLKTASCITNSIILLKGAKTMISEKSHSTWIIPEGTPALARGGSGDVLSGFLGGLICQSEGKSNVTMGKVVAGGAWLHQQGGILASKKYTEMGVDGVTLSKFITKAIKHLWDYSYLN